MEKNFEGRGLMGVEMGAYAAFVSAISQVGKMIHLNRLSKLLEAEDGEPPVTFGERAYDLIFVACTDPDKWPEDDNELIEMYADWLQHEFIDVKLSAGVG